MSQFPMPTKKSLYSPHDFADGREKLIEAADGAVFDLDDTIASTKALHCEILLATFSALNSTHGVTTVLKKMGETIWGNPYRLLLPGLYSIAIEEGVFTKEITEQEFISAYYATLGEYYRNPMLVQSKIEFVPGARTLLERMTALTKNNICIFSGSPEMLCQLVHFHLNLPETIRIKCVCSTEEDGFLPPSFTKADSLGWIKACSRLGSPPHECIAFTDCNKEALGALHAHMRCVVRLKDGMQSVHHESFDDIQNRVQSPWYPFKANTRLCVVSEWHELEIQHKA